MKPPLKSLGNSNRHQTRYHQLRLDSGSAAASLAMPSAALAPLHKGFDSSRAHAGPNVITGITLWEEALEEPGLFSLAGQRLRRDVEALHRHQRLRKYKGRLFRLRHNFHTITNACNNAAVNTAGRFQSREIPCP